MSHIDEVTTQLMNKASLTTKDKNCIHYVGDFKQVFVQSLRRLDGARKLHLTPVTLEELQHNISTGCAVVAIEESALLEGKLENNKILQTLKESGYSVEKTHFNSPKLKRNMLIFSTH